MENVILIVVFNYNRCLNNVEFIKKLYGPYFKKIIFYSDIPETGNSEINFINIEQGHYTHRIFNHFYKKYIDLIDKCDGLFYTMDDNIINLNILNLMDCKKILYYYRELKELNHYSGWHWDYPFGKEAINNLSRDVDFQKFNINKFSGAFADWFYLPKQYLTDELFELFDLFAKYRVFLELAIPSIINNIELDKEKYVNFTDEVIWGKDRIKFFNKNYIYDSLNHQHNLVIHPVKFNQNPSSKLWLEDIFCKNRCVIITTINKPTESILKHISNTMYDTIIIGDKKTPDDYRRLNCIYLDIDTQAKLFPELCEIIPYNHYCRKNLGYLYAIKKGYQLIYETDDDNIPYQNFDNFTNPDRIISEKNNTWINIFKYFTNNAHIWPRGFPITLLKNVPNFVINSCDKNPAIINGLVENDPDVDACFRLICNHQDTIKWEKNKSIIIDNKNICLFNTQNTFWTNSDLFISMLIPCSVSFRYCDILRGIITNVILKQTDNYMMYTSPNVIQVRNDHNLIDDFKSEFEMYIHNVKILEYIEDNITDSMNTKYLLGTIYDNLLKNNVITQKDVDILNIWFKYFN